MEAARPRRGGDKSLADKLSDGRSAFAIRKQTLTDSFLRQVQASIGLNPARRLLIDKMVMAIILSEQLEAKIGAGGSTAREQDRYARLVGSIARLFKELKLYDVSDRLLDTLDGEGAALEGYLAMNYGVGLQPVGEKVYDPRPSIRDLDDFEDDDLDDDDDLDVKPRKAKTRTKVKTRKTIKRRSPR